MGWTTWLIRTTTVHDIISEGRPPKSKQKVWSDSSIFELFQLFRLFVVRAVRQILNFLSSRTANIYCSDSGVRCSVDPVVRGSNMSNLLKVFLVIRRAGSVPFCCVRQSSHRQYLLFDWLWKLRWFHLQHGGVLL